MVARTLNSEFRIMNPVGRRGLSVIEVTMALLILSFAVAGLLQILTMAARQRQATEIRRLALEEVGNRAELIALLPWNELTSEKLAAGEASAELLALAPGARLSVTAQDDVGPPAAKRIHIAMTWTAPDGDSAEPVELTLWRYKP